MASKVTEETKVKKPVVAKKATKKVVAKTEEVKAEAAVKTMEKTVKTKTEENVTITLDSIGIDGKSSGKVTLPAELFGAAINKTLIAQAVRVYLTNQRQGNASTKTRGEVDGSSKKIYRQKGTGRARHGTLRAPIFVKGGIVFGPKPRDYSLSLPKKMKRKALVSALSAKAKDNQIVILSGLGDLEPKTKLFADMLNKVGLKETKNVLFVVSSTLQSARRAGSNIPTVRFANVEQLNVYEIMQARQLVFDKTVLDELKKRFVGEAK